jgi:probable HAF family extracellular repeat protein
MTDLGTLARNYSIAYDVNNNGQIVGVSSAPGGYHAFLYSGGTMTDLGTLGGKLRAARGINDDCQIVGISFTSGGHDNAFLLNPLDPPDTTFLLAPPVKPRCPRPSSCSGPAFWGYGVLGGEDKFKITRSYFKTSSLVTV